MKIFKIICLMLLAFSMNAYSQQGKSTASRGSTALLFSFSGVDNLSLQNYKSGIGGKYYLDDRLAFRIGLQLQGSSKTTPVHTDQNQEALDGESSSFTFGLSGAVEWHLKHQRVSPFVGGGLSLLNTSSEEKEGVVWTTGETGLVTRTRTKTNGGLTYRVLGLAGLEVFLTNSISFIAEYEIGFTHDSSDEVEKKIEVIQGSLTNPSEFPKIKGPSSNSYGINSAGFLTVAVYF